MFSVLCFIPEFGAAFWSFPLSLAVTVLLAAVSVRFVRNPVYRKLAVLRKILEYIPFILFAAFIIRRSGSADGFFILDLLTVLCWIAVFILSFVTLYRLSDKRIQRHVPSFQFEKKRKKNVAVHILEWLDALIQAACLVLLVNLFFFQLYAIPTESMVPEFMVKDRVVVVKTPSGPKFPLSEVGVPRLRDYKRGNIVVFNNPHYNDTKADRVRSFVSQLIYMLTFTSVNINVDEFGDVKADPLVKRVTGIPGEKLMLVDGILYSKTRSDPAWHQVTEDASWATWNLAALPRTEYALVKDKLFSRDEFSLLESVESRRAALDPDQYTTESAELVKRFRSLKTTRDTVMRAPDLFEGSRMEIFWLYKNNIEASRILLNTDGGAAWFDEFLTAWEVNPERDNLFNERTRNLNLLIKHTLARLLVRNAELMQDGKNAPEDYGTDAERIVLDTDMRLFLLYISIHDQRNMGEFPPEEESYIPEDSYFMMGDNRFNSLDMRHSYVRRLIPLDNGDRYSILYRSNLEPRFVPAHMILGTALFRFWPLSRAGVPQ